MIEDLKSMAIFAEVAKKGSFRAASVSLNLSPSVVSYHVSQLENRLGTTLVYRSTRKLSLTHEGRTLLEHTVAMLNSAHAGINHFVSKNTDPEGKLTISLPALFSRSELLTDLGTFRQRFPRLHLSLVFSDEREALIDNNIDLAVRIGELPDSTLKYKQLGVIHRKLIAHRELIKKYGNPTELEDLSGWPWIGLTMMRDKRQFTHKNKQKAEVSYESAISVNNVDAMSELALLGVGIATPPSFLVVPHINKGDVVELLKDWQVEPIPYHLVWPGQAPENANTRRLIDFLSEKAKGSLP
ncbi:transcriptional regulator [Veronia nyctiphanis]|uniref:Transcriptional regulator n=1 Tax=Veronia nyctiphanis TaxID=1278244 RepID=A0A4Q0Z0I1_9GAMM|nr:LysR family transcriptional regulator [Veronia nyctiphanis]RXJ74929.1 transcriptional regulator [Veronia nyctiphanis]